MYIVLVTVGLCHTRSVAIVHNISCTALLLSVLLLFFDQNFNYHSIIKNIVLHHYHLFHDLLQFWNLIEVINLQILLQDVSLDIIIII